MALYRRIPVFLGMASMDHDGKKCSMLSRAGRMGMLLLHGAASSPAKHQTASGRREKRACDCHVQILCAVSWHSDKRLHYGDSVSVFMRSDLFFGDKKTESVQLRNHRRRSGICRPFLGSLIFKIFKVE